MHPGAPSAHPPLLRRRPRRRPKRLDFFLMCFCLSTLACPFAKRHKHVLLLTVISISCPLSCLASLFHVELGFCALSSRALGALTHTISSAPQRGGSQGAGLLARGSGSRRKWTLHCASSCSYLPTERFPYSSECCSTGLLRTGSERVANERVDLTSLRLEKARSDPLQGRRSSALPARLVARRMLSSAQSALCVKEEQKCEIRNEPSLHVSSGATLSRRHSEERSTACAAHESYNPIALTLSSSCQRGSSAWPSRRTAGTPCPRCCPTAPGRAGCTGSLRRPRGLSRPPGRPGRSPWPSGP